MSYNPSLQLSLWTWLFFWWNAPRICLWTKILVWKDFLRGTVTWGFYWLFYFSAVRKARFKKKDYRNFFGKAVFEIGISLGVKVFLKFKLHSNPSPSPPPPPLLKRKIVNPGVLPSADHTGMCLPWGGGFRAKLVWKRVIMYSFFLS